MSGAQLTAVLIVAIVMFASIIKSKHGHRRGAPHLGADGAPIQDSGETQRLREEVRHLKERLAVIERITVEKENSLSDEIERLRDRER